MRKLKGYLVAGLTLGLVGSTPFLATQIADAQDSTTEVIVGGGEGEIAVNIYRAKEITVNVNETVHFQWEYIEPHTVTFGIPTGDPTVPTPGADTGVVEFSGSEFISSGLILGEDASLDVKFTATGSFDYFCVIHPLMLGTVNVVDEGGESQDEITARGDEEYATALAALQALDEELETQEQVVTPNDNGGSTYEITVGGDTADGAINKYYPSEQTITTDDTVLWRAVEMTPHSITFGPFVPQGDPFEAPASIPDDNAWDGTGTVHSGMLGTGWPGGTSFALSFTQPGTYEYRCVLHDYLGQLGTITVTAAEEPSPTPEPTATTVPPTNTPVPTATSVQPTATSVPPTSTVVPATATSVPATAVPSTVPKPPNTGEGVTSTSSNFRFIAIAGILLALGSAGLMFANNRK